MGSLFGKKRDTTTKTREPGLNVVKQEDDDKNDKKKAQINK